MFAADSPLHVTSRGERISARFYPVVFMDIRPGSGHSAGPILMTMAIAIPECCQNGPETLPCREFLGQNLEFPLQPVNHLIPSADTPLHLLHAAFYDLKRSGLDIQRSCIEILVLRNPAVIRAVECASGKHERNDHQQQRATYVPGAWV